MQNLAKIGLINSIYDAAAAIDFGRKGFAIRGKAEEGRVSYETGIAVALSAFRDAASTADPETIILAEYTFLSQELQFCNENDKAALISLTQAKRGFYDAFLAIKVVEEKTHYHAVDDTTPHHKDYRYYGFPLDSLSEYSDNISYPSSFIINFLFYDAFLNSPRIIFLLG
jgi:hypothetical protein